MEYNSREILKKYWGYSSFRSVQEEIINSVLQNEDTIALLPTGGGKSICFQIPTLLKPGICIVISPLIALIEDQVRNLNAKGIKATSIPSGSRQDDIIRIFDNIRFGDYKFLYLPPERLQSRFIQEKIKQLNINLFAIDEAHCISEWGHDFRPSYLHLQMLKELFPKIPVIAVTATATQKVIEDIKTYLKLHSPSIFKKSFFRKNLGYHVIYSDDKLYQLENILRKIKAPSIVYTASRNKTKEICAYLNANNFKCSFYHGGLNSEEKKLAYENWMAENTPIMIATNAFGMGIDKPNVRTVVHLNLPSSLENYMQEAGRAGRDQENAHAVILTNENDLHNFKEIQSKQYPSITQIKHIYQKLHQYFQIAKGELREERFNLNVPIFCNQYGLILNKTIHALNILSANGIVELNANANKKSSIKFIVNNNTLIGYSRKSELRYAFVQTILRMYGGVFEQSVKINEFEIAKKIGTTSTQIIFQLEELAKLELLEYHKSTKDIALYFLHPREDGLTINRISKRIASFLKQKQQKIAEVVTYVTNNNTCRNRQLLNYFGEKHTVNCGICNVCLKKSKSKADLSPLILHHLREGQKLSSKEICLRINAKEEDILIHLRELLAIEKIGITNYHKFYLL